MSSPFWKYPGVFNGRIAPVYASSLGTEIGVDYSGLYYGYTWSYYYSYYQNHSWCGGEDSLNLPDYRFQVEDSSIVRQTLIDLTGIDLIYFGWYLRNPINAPSAKTVLSAGACEFKTTDLVATGDQLPGILLPSNAPAFFSQSDTDRQVLVSGTVSNNGTYRILGVPWNQGKVVASPGLGEVMNGRVAILDAGNPTTLVVESPGAATIKVLGSRWVARAYVDATERVTLRERAGRSWNRSQLAMHVSKLAGLHTIKFLMELEMVQ